MPSQSTKGSMGDYVKSLKQKLEFIETEISTEKQRLLEEAAVNPAINIDQLRDQFFSIVELQHFEWMKNNKPQ
jgi:hypothetical protein